MDLVLADLEILKNNFKKCSNAGDMVLGIDLVVGASLVEGNAIYYMEGISSVEGTAVLKVWLELNLTAALVL